jgi:hypothetical protein
VDSVTREAICGADTLSLRGAAEATSSMIRCDVPKIVSPPGGSRNDR